MKPAGKRSAAALWSLLGATGLLVNLNCGGGSAGTGTGGSGGHAGAAGGAGGHGGPGGTGGQAGSSGGAAGTVAGSGGSGATAGSSANGGSGGVGGAAGTTGGTAGSITDGGGVAAFSYAFDTDKEGMALNGVNSAGNLVNVTGGSPPSLSWDGVIGYPSPGSVEVDATFTAYNQFVLSSLNLSPLLNAVGKTAHVFVRVDKVDGGGGFAGIAQLEASSTTADHGASGAAISLTPGQWKELTLDLTTQPQPFDPSQIIQFSVNFSTGSGPDGGTFGAPVHAVFHIDSLSDGSGGAPPPPLDQTFDKSVGSFAVSPTTTDGGTPPTLTWDPVIGNPSPGSLKLAGSSTGYNVQLSLSPPTNLGGQTIHAKVLLDGTDGGQAVGGVSAEVHASSTGYVYANGVAIGLTSGVWTDVTLDLASPAYAAPGFDPSQIVQVGVLIGIGASADAGVFPGAQGLTFHVDSIVAQ